MIDDDRFIIETSDKWYCDEDNSGNILDQDMDTETAEKRRDLIEGNSV